MLLCVLFMYCYVIHVMSCMFMKTHVIKIADDCVAGCGAWVRAMAGYPLLSDAANDIYE